MNRWARVVFAEDAHRIAEWEERAACKREDPSVFFGEKGEKAEDAREVCFRCPVREECLAYALEANEVHGVWGGLTRRERVRLRRGMGTPPAEAGGAPGSSR